MSLIQIGLVQRHSLECLCISKHGILTANCPLVRDTAPNTPKIE